MHGVAHFLRLRGALAGHPTARVLHALVLALAIWHASISIVALPLYPDTASRLLRLRFSLLVGLVPVTTLLLLRLGHFRQAAFFYLAGQWAHATYNIAVSGSIQITSTGFYITLPILAAWLFGFRGALWTAGWCLASALILILRQESRGVLPSAPMRLPLLIWANLVQLTLTAAVPVAHILQTLRETLAELQQYRHNLEQLVEQRTAELVVARDQALAASHAKGAFLANMSHELRTPLNAILGFSHLLRERGASQQQRHALDIINRSGEHLLALIDDVLDVAKVEAGKSQLELAPCDLARLIEDVTNMVAPRASQKGLDLRVERPRSALVVCADASRLRQVLINLLNNAVKFTDRGSVTLRVQATPSVDARLMRVVFEIEDTGEGIAAVDQAVIFDAFVQTGTTKHREGAGLGLTITRQIIELMGGTIEVESESGHGSRFRAAINLELADESEVKEGANFERITGLAEGQPQYRVLIVEDQQENWMLLQGLLEDVGFHVRVAEDGARAVKEFRESRPQFIWMDLRMPVMDGIEAARCIRACDGGHEVKIAAVTAAGSTGEREEVLAKGFDDYIRKPCRPAEIFECMARHLGVRYQVGEEPRLSEQEQGGQSMAKDISALPEELRNELREAVISLDPARIAFAIERISQENRELGVTLAHHARRVAYSKIHNAMVTAGAAKGHRG